MKNLQEYIDLYGEEEGTKRYESNKRKAITLNNMILKYGEEEGTKRYNECIEKKRSKSGYNYYLTKHPGATLEEYKQNFNHTSKTSFIKRYGEEEGIKRYNEYIEKNVNAVRKNREAFIDKYGLDAYKKQHCLSLENFVLKYGEVKGHEKWKSYIEKLSFANSLEGYKERYGDELGQQKWNEYKEKLRKANKNGSEHFKYINSLQYYIDTYGNDLGKQKYEEYKKKLDRSSLKYFMNKYRDENIALEMYKKSCKKHASKNHIYYSMQSLELFNLLYEYILLFDNKPDIQYAEKGGEFKLFDENNNIRFYDFRYKNIIIEFNGDYWHANPKIYGENDLVHHTFTAKQIWENDKKKKDLLEKHNYKLMCVWENEYEKDKPLTIKNIL